MRITLLLHIVYYRCGNDFVIAYGIAMSGGMRISLLHMV